MSPDPQLSPALDHQAYQELFKDRPVSQTTERRSRGQYVLKTSQPWTSECSFSLGTFQLPQTFCPGSLIPQPLALPVTL